MYIVYKHTSPSNKVYIGITCQQLKDRARSDGSGYKTQKLFWRAIQKYGWDNFKHEVLFCDLTKEKACEKEIELIAKYKSDNPKYGYNFCLGGDLGPKGCTWVMLEDAKQKIREYQKNKVVSQEARKHLSEAKKGTHLSEETKKKISASKKGKHPWNYGKKTGPMSDAQKRKISASNKGKNTWTKGRKLSAETIEKLRKASTGVVFTRERKESISKALKGRKFSEERKNSISKSLTGRTIPEETRLKMKKAQQLRREAEKLGLTYTEYKNQMAGGK